MIKAHLKMNTENKDSLESALHYLEKRFGLEFPTYKSKEFIIKIEMAFSNSEFKSLEEYLLAISSDSLPPKEVDNLLSNITIGESYFFRHSDQLESIIDDILPTLDERMTYFSEPLRIWSAGCSRGEEPYTIAIKNDSNKGSLRHRVEIIGTDLNADVLKTAKKAKFKSWSLRDVPEYILARYFLREMDNYYLKDEIKKMVQFKRHNLADPIAHGPFGHDKEVDLVICRNVLIYFSKQQYKMALEKICEVLSPGGFLVLGPSESLFDFDLPLDQVKTGKTIAYRKRTKGVPSGGRGSVATLKTLKLKTAFRNKHKKDLQNYQNNQNPKKYNFLSPHF